MSLADLLPGRLGPSGRIPGRVADLHGPLSGIIMLPRNLAWPGMRECDVSDGQHRRTMYAMLLTHGKRNDIARLINAGLLVQDWPLIAGLLRHGLRRRCERQLGLGRAAEAGVPAGAASTGSAPG